MQTFAFFIEDDRYTVPTLKLECFADEMEARRRAALLLAQSPHHRGVEVCADGKRRFGVGTYAQVAPIPPGAPGEASQSALPV